MDIRLAEPGLFMTDETMNAFSPKVLEGIQKSVSPGDHVIITGPRDFDESGTASIHLKSLFNDAGYNEDFADSLIDRFGYDPAAAAASAPMNRFSDSRWSEIAETLGYEDVQKAQLDARELYKDNACSITLPGTMDINSIGHDISSPAGMSEGILQAWPGRLANETIAGSREELQLWVAHHEIDHCHNVDNKYYEYSSDTYANSQYAQDLQEGRAVNPELPYAMRTMRASAAILGTSGDAYLTNGLSMLAGETPLTEAELDIAHEQILQAQSRIYNDIQFEKDIRHETLLDPNNSRMNARLAYQHGENLLKQGMFDDIPYGKTTVERFVEGAQRYGQEYYNVAQKDRIDIPPEFSPQARGLSMPAFAAEMERNGATLDTLQF